jgi:hypothetical protein
VLVCSERRVLLAGCGWLRLVAGGWFVLREKYCWLVADKPSEQAGYLICILSPAAIRFLIFCHYDVFSILCLLF